MKKLFTMVVLLVAAGCATRMPKPIVLDVDRAGQASLGQGVIAEAELKEALKHRYESQGACPVLIRGVSDTSHKAIRNVMDQCLISGHWELALSLPDATPESLQPWLSEDMATRRSQFRLREPPEIRNGRESPLPAGFHILVAQQGFIVESKIVEKEALLTQLTNLGETKDVFITCLADSKHGDTVWLLETCGSLDIKQVWLTSM